MILLIFFLSDWHDEFSKEMKHNFSCYKFDAKCTSGTPFLLVMENVIYYQLYEMNEVSYMHLNVSNLLTLDNNRQRKGA